MVLPLGCFRKRSLPIPNIILPRPIDIIFTIVKEFNPMGDPAGHSGDCEEDGVHVGGEAHCSVDQAGVEIYIGVQFAGYEVLVFKGDFFELEGDLD